MLSNSSSDPGPDPAATAFTPSVKPCGKSVWLESLDPVCHALLFPATANIKVGETYYYSGGMEMKDFESKQLGKTFDFITFADMVTTNKDELNKAKVKNPHKAANEAKENKMIDKLAKNAGDIYLEDLFKNKNSYSNKEIEINGVVVKVNKNILDKNWIHIIDGTKTETNSSLTITSTEMVKVGDTVTVNGKIVLDKDFGYGYVYDIILEEGKFK